VTTVDKPAQVAAPASYRKGSIIADWLSSTDHKIIGHLYLITSFFFFMADGHGDAGAALGAQQLPGV
jgi:cytochrome c oxidase subunit 1